MDLHAFVAAALDEDIGPGDLTSEACIDLALDAQAQIVAKQALVVCGHEVAGRVFAEVVERYRCAPVEYQVEIADAATAQPGEVIARLSGPARAILVGERVALNVMMRLSGIATHVQAYVAAAGPDGPRVVDTRKTTPLLRDLEKYAVRTGGAYNHRRGLYDGVMIKDNHIAAMGSITAAVQRVREAVHHLVKIEVEVTDVGGLEEAMNAGADVVLLDNMGDDQLAECVRVARSRRPSLVLEASGNMTPQRIVAIRDIGLDVVSAGGLIHQATWVDLSLRVSG